ncbi:amino acid adenylation domain-containing protein [Streptomyces sulfonofaciens]|uniref:amino acid adenylation domain-containing protein n=1 Tax=Streptomyces sulfonofaciens TaxID=68272 RepID=UPI0016732D8B|nr:amino acid adenylation domain-containing protein [Streptomyces sulfonofaciens]
MTTPDDDPTLYGLFAAQAARTPAHEAVRDGCTSLGYGELRSRVDALADAIRRSDPGAGSRIGLYVGRGVDMVAAVLAVAAAGHTYVPMDPAYPEDRVRFMAEDSGIRLVLSDAEPPDGLFRVPVLRLDRLDTAPGPRPAAVHPATSGTSAYVIYTSGSTGRPKGVEVSQRNAVALVRGVCARYDFRTDDVWTLFHSYCFDFSVWEMWGALATGATLVVVPERTALSPRATAELLVRERVTVLNVVPSVFRYLVGAVTTMRDSSPALRRVLFGGEPVEPADINLWRRRFGDSCQFVNLYGITETTVFVCARTLDPGELEAEDQEAVRALGAPLPGWSYHVLDEHGEPVARGGTGEIWVTGDGVAVGYLGRPALTAERFRALPLPGGTGERSYRSGDLATRTQNDVFCFSGRSDDQVKINGFRIELGEVEGTLRRLPAIADAAVVRSRSRVGGHLLTAYVVCDDGVPDEEIVRQAGAALPRHMMPGRFVRLPELPRNAAGKTDRRALTEADRGSGATTPR